MGNMALIVSLVFFTGAPLAEETLREVSWTDLQAEGNLKCGSVLPADDSAPFERLEIANPSGEALTAEILTIERPGVTRSAYAIAGQLSHQDVEGKGHLEMWSFFPDGGFYFSRTLGEIGPMRHLEGSSDWRLFTLPFFIGEDPRRPQKLVLNVVLPGRGTVWLGPLHLVQYAKGEGMSAAPRRWWSDQTGGIIGGLLGAALGCLGGTIGMLAARAKRRGLAMCAMKAAIATGAGLLFVGIVALARSQPLGVWVPLLILGALWAAVPAATVSRIRRQYEQVELRKMKAKDAS